MRIIKKQHILFSFLMNSLFQEFSLLGCSAEKWRSFSFVSFLVYQILVYLLIGQFWLLLSTLQQSLCWWELQSGGGQRSDFEWCKVIVKEDTLKDFLQVNALAKNSDKKIPRRILYSLEKDVQEKTKFVWLILLWNKFPCFWYHCPIWKTLVAVLSLSL